MNRNALTMRYPSLAKRTNQCPHPEKLSFPTARGARAAARRLLLRHDKPDEQEPYRCACGRYHLATIEGEA